MSMLSDSFSVLSLTPQKQQVWLKIVYEDNQPVDIKVYSSEPLARAALRRQKLHVNEIRLSHMKHLKREGEHPKKARFPHGHHYLDFDGLVRWSHEAFNNRFIAWWASLNDDTPVDDNEWHDEINAVWYEGDVSFEIKCVELDSIEL